MFADFFQLGNTEFVTDVLILTNQAKSKGEAKRLIEGGGVSINDTKVVDPFAKLTDEVLSAKTFVLHKGKKVHLSVKMV